MKNNPKIRGHGKSADPRARNSGRGKSGKGLLSKELLHDLRNKIPVRGLIENELGLRCETESGIFRYECPECGSFHTSVMKSENLARCFECEISLNPIDMVMAVKGTKFRPSADFLVNILESMPAKPAAPAKRDASELVSLSSVLSSMAEPPPDGETAERRVRRLEKEVAELRNRTDRLLRVVGAILTKRGNAREIFAKTDG